MDPAPSGPAPCAGMRTTTPPPAKAALRRQPFFYCEGAFSQRLQPHRVINQENEIFHRAWAAYPCWSSNPGLALSHSLTSPAFELLSGQAVIVSTARTGLAKSFRGGFNATHGAALGGHAIRHAIAKAGIEPEAGEDVFMGCGMPEGESGMNIGRNAALAGGCPVSTSGTTINRFCSSGLQAVAMAAQSIVVDGVPVAIGGGLDSISLVQPKMIKGVVVERKSVTCHRIKANFKFLGAQCPAPP